MKRIAVLAGGSSSEAAISLKSAKVVAQHIDNKKYNVELITLTDKNWKTESGFIIDKNDFSYLNNDEKIKFDGVVIMIHGTPGEDGKLQGYFDMLNIPYVGCNQLASSITFNKWTCNTLLKAGGFNVARSIVLRSNKEHYNPLDFYNEIGLPMFIKPNNGGSSFGVSKVKTINEIGKAIDDAFKEGSEVIIESAIEGKEYTCGVYKHKKEIKALPITEIISDSEFFDYAAKYEGKSKEITPARLDETTTVKLQNMCCEAYKYLHLGGFVRIDFMYNGNEAFIIEINTVPGMSEQSIIPQQVRANGMDLTEFITAFIDELFDQ